MHYILILSLNVHEEHHAQHQNLHFLFEHKVTKKMKDKPT